MSLNSPLSFDGLFDTPASQPTVTEPASKPAAAADVKKPKQKRKRRYAPGMFEMLARIAEHGPIGNDNLARLMKVDAPLVRRRTSALGERRLIENVSTEYVAKYKPTAEGYAKLAALRTEAITPAAAPSLPAVKPVEPVSERIVATPPAERTVTRPSKAETVLVRRWYLVNRESKVETLLTEAQAADLQKIFPVMDGGA